MNNLYKNLAESLLELVIETSTNLPQDVRSAIKDAANKEIAGTRSALALSTIMRNIDMSERTKLPICQDTGLPTFKIKVPVGFNQIKMKKLIEEAISEATAQGRLRTNSVDSLTGENSGNNLGKGTPAIYFEQWENEDEIEIKLVLKGGGCENKNIQYSLPCELEGLGKAGRDLDGIRKCILHSVYQAQGQGCSVGFIGVSIGSDRAGGYSNAKEQLFRPLEDENPIEDLKKLEEYILDKANTLGIGTMGFGGESTLLGCKIGVQNRVPASFFVSVAYNCWAFRRLGFKLDAKTGEIKKWLYNHLSESSQKSYASCESCESCESQSLLTGKEISLNTPLDEKQVRELKVGDVVLLNGRIYTGRDAVHKHLHETGSSPVDLNGQIIYHCGPVMVKENNKWSVKGAGPTTSIREEPYQGEIIKKFGIRAVIGKGGMGTKTLQAMKEFGAVYLNAIGGAAQYYSQCIKNVKSVELLQFGIPEAMWEFEVENFPAIVTMDSHGNSLHADIDKSSFDKLCELKDKVF